jgi:hypothetical protein
VRAFDDAANRNAGSIQFIKDNFGYPEEDIKVCLNSSGTRSTNTALPQAWLNTVGYPDDCGTIHSKVIDDTLR